jgi:hypothetical protein
MHSTFKRAFAHSKVALDLEQHKFDVAVLIRFNGMGNKVGLG